MPPNGREGEKGGEKQRCSCTDLDVLHLDVDEPGFRHALLLYILVYNGERLVEFPAPLCKEGTKLL